MVNEKVLQDVYAYIDANKEFIIEKTGVKKLKILEKEDLMRYNISIDLK